MLSLPPAFVLSQDQTLKLKERFKHFKETKDPKDENRPLMKAQCQLVTVIKSHAANRRSTSQQTTKTTRDLSRRVPSTPITIRPKPDKEPKPNQSDELKLNVTASILLTARPSQTEPARTNAAHVSLSSDEIVKQRRIARDQTGSQSNPRNTPENKTTPTESPKQQRRKCDPAHHQAPKTPNKAEKLSTSPPKQRSVMPHIEPT